MEKDENLQKITKNLEQSPLKDNLQQILNTEIIKIEDTKFDLSKTESKAK